MSFVTHLRHDVHLRATIHNNQQFAGGLLCELLFNFLLRLHGCQQGHQAPPLFLAVLRRAHLVDLLAVLLSMTCFATLEANLLATALLGDVSNLPALEALDLPLVLALAVALAPLAPTLGAPCRRPRSHP